MHAGAHREEWLGHRGLRLARVRLSWLRSGGFRRRPWLPRREVSLPAAGCFRYLAARPTSVARLACSPPSPRPASPRRVERARGGADWARAEPNFASNGCDDAFNSLSAGTAHLPARVGVRGPARSLLSSRPLPPLVSSGLAGSDGFVQREQDRFRVLAFGLR